MKFTATLLVLKLATLLDVVSPFQPIPSFRNSNRISSSPSVGIARKQSHFRHVFNHHLPLTSSTTSLHMKVTIDIDIGDMPNFEFPHNTELADLDMSAITSLLDANAYSSLLSSLTSFVALPSDNMESFNAVDINTIFPMSESTSNDFLQLFEASCSSVLVLSTLLYALSFPADDFREGYEPYPRGEYDPNVAREYYSKRPMVVIQRFLQLVRIGYKWIFRYLYERFIYKNDSKESQQQCAEEVLEIIQKVGPTAIKVGQALSVRPDIIPEVYTQTLSKLQDNVPPFDSSQAQELLRSELGYEKFRMLKDIDLDDPVASASVGQVYRGIVELDGSDVEVAVKVQRPNGLSEIALDLFLTRELAPFYQKLTMNDTPLQSLADEWGRGFIAELTYEQEARNTIRFNEEMKQKNMNAVCAPTVIERLSTNRVLTTEWIHGVRLDRSDEEDVARLCGVALNSYLVMLLETGTLHCDPHPGNLMRTTDGKLCILDFGMTLETPEDLQYSLLEFIAHLTSENWDAIPQDLVNLQFLKQEKLELFLQLGVLEPMFYFFKQMASGGGGAKVRDRIMEEYRQKYPGSNEYELREHMRKEIAENTEKVVEKASALTGITIKIEDLQRENSDAFIIPEWFLYTSRAFLTLEGISLQADPDFSIIKSCFPYIAKRLIGDDDPRSQAALKNMLYGEGEHINADKISELADGFTQYTTTTKIVCQDGTIDDQDKSKNLSSSKNGVSAEAAITLAKDSAEIFLNPADNLVQNIIIEEGATAVQANVKDALREILVKNPERIRASLPFGFLMPKLPSENLAIFLEKSQREEQVQTLLQKFPLPSPPSPEELGNVIRSIDTTDPLATLIDGMSPEEVAVIWKAIRENVPIYAPRAVKLGGKLASSVFEKVSEDIDNVIGTAEELDEFMMNSAKGVSAAAKAVAKASADVSRDSSSK